MKRQYLFFHKKGPVHRHKKRANNSYLWGRYINIILNLTSFILLILLIALYFLFSLVFYIQGRNSKYVTNESTTVVMVVIGVLYVSLCSSTVQIHDSLGSRRACACSDADFSNQNGNRRTAVYCAFLWAKGLTAKDIHKEMFPVNSRKCLSRKEVHNWAEKLGKHFAYDEEFETEVRKWLRQQSTTSCSRFRHTDKAMGQVYEC
jgi:hypothetical protein